MGCSSLDPEAIRGTGGPGGESSQALVTVSTATACTTGTQCPTGYCVDGFCCDNQCDNLCMACSAAKKGQGIDGVCGSIKYDTDPDNDCPYGACGGKNTCKNYNGFSCTAAAECFSNACVDGVCCNNICAGTCQACTASKKGAGSDGTCGPITNERDPDDECSGGTCHGGGCKQYNGVPCTDNKQCLSNQCADGFCCDTACTGSCQACSAAKKGSGNNGACGAIANAQDPDNECAAGSCNGAGVCMIDSLDGRPAGSACVAGSECSSRICNNLVCESPKPANGPLMWMTLRDGAIVAVEDPWQPGHRFLELREISSLLDIGTSIGVNGYVSWKDSLGIWYAGGPLGGGFSAAGEALPQRLPIFSAYYGSPNRTLYRGGSETYAHRSGNSTCTNKWPGYIPANSNTLATALAGAGKNDAGQQGAIIGASRCAIDMFQTPFDVGDGILHDITEKVLVRYSPAGPVELDIPRPIDLIDPIMLGPNGEFHSLDTTNHYVVKYNPAGVLAWKIPISGTFTSSAFAVDATGNLLIGFSFTGSVDFGAGPLTASGTDLGLVKLNPSGSVIWQKRYAGGVENVKLVRAGAADFAILARRTAAMDLGTGAITGNTVLAKFNSSGNALWHANFDNLGNLAVSADKAGSVYLGTSSLTADFGWGTPMSNWIVGIAMAKYGTCTGAAGCKARTEQCSANTECSSGSCVSGTCF